MVVAKFRLLISLRKGAVFKDDAKYSNFKAKIYTNFSYTK